MRTWTFDLHAFAEMDATRRLIALWAGQETHAPEVDGWRERLRDATLAGAARSIWPSSPSPTPIILTTAQSGDPNQPAGPANPVGFHRVRSCVSSICGGRKQVVAAFDTRHRGRARHLDHCSGGLHDSKCTSSKPDTRQASHHGVPIS